ncbi:MAG: DUF2203 domain-containing protein [Dehalococcoidia bacterium]
MPHFFTLDEARATLPAVRDLILELQEQKRRLDTVRAQVESAGRKARSNGSLGGTTADGGRPEIERLAQRIQAGLRRIDEIGCHVKDLNLGLVDWSTLRDGHEVYLCGRPDEPDILHWHEIADGFSGRQPL